MHAFTFTCEHIIHVFEYWNPAFKCAWGLEGFVDLDILLCLDVLDLQILLHFKDWLFSTLRRF